MIPILKNTGQSFFDAESIYEISKSYLKLVTDGRTEARTHKPKAICPFNFFKVGGHKTERLSCCVILITLAFICFNCEIKPHLKTLVCVSFDF